MSVSRARALLAAAVRRLPVRLAAAGLALLLLAPAFSLLAARHDCACGMGSACFCGLGMRKGAHCATGGDGCSMRSCGRSSGEVLLASLDLRGWLACRPTGLAAPALAGRIAAPAMPPARVLANRPAIPPPRPSPAG